jgi:hypothetical protein
VEVHLILGPCSGLRGVALFVAAFLMLTPSRSRSPSGPGVRDAENLGASRRRSSPRWCQGRLGYSPRGRALAWAPSPRDRALFDASIDLPGGHGDRDPDGDRCLLLGIGLTRIRADPGDARDPRSRSRLRRAVGRPAASAAGAVGRHHRDRDRLMVPDCSACSTPARPGWVGAGTVFIGVALLSPRLVRPLASVVGARTGALRVSRADRPRELDPQPRRTATPPRPDDRARARLLRDGLRGRPEGLDRRRHRRDPDRTCS